MQSTQTHQEDTFHNGSQEEQPCEISACKFASVKLFFWA